MGGGRGRANSETARVRRVKVSRLEERREARTTEAEMAALNESVLLSVSLPATLLWAVLWALEGEE